MERRYRDYLRWASRNDRWPLCRAEFERRYRQDPRRSFEEIDTT